MSRIKPDPIIRGDDWDLDESAILRGGYGYLELQRVGLAIAQVSNVDLSATDTTDEEVVAASRALARAVLLMYRDVTLRKPGQSYQEGIDRPRVDFTEDELIGPDVGTATLSFLANRGILHVQSVSPVADAAATITPAAKEAGLTPGNFSVNGADQGRVPAGQVR